MRYFIEMAYNGSTFNGWQIQPNAPSVQQTLQEKLAALLRGEVEVVGAGRTDTGVHARYYVAHFDSSAEFDPQQLCQTLNRMLPQSIVLYSIQPVSDEAHARFSAISRSYEYHIARRKDPFAHHLAWYVYGAIDVAAMNEACKVLFEYVDFTSFSKLHTDVKTNNCTIHEAYWKESATGLVFTISADRFLRNMVRAITGTMIDIGRGKLSTQDFRSIIESKNRGAAGQSALAQGLFLTDVQYPEQLFNRQVCT